jgi:hypothetical protein
MTSDATDDKGAKRTDIPVNQSEPGSPSDEEMEREIRRLHERINAELAVLEEQADRLLKSRVH